MVYIELSEHDSEKVVVASLSRYKETLVDLGSNVIDDFDEIIPAIDKVLDHYMGFNEDE